MKGDLKLGPTAVAAIMILCSNPLALAQVDWTFQDLEIQLGPPGAWNDTGQLVKDVVFDGTTYHLYLLGGQTTLPWTSPWSVGHWTSNDLNGPWVEDPANPVLEPDPGQWDGYTILSAAVLYDTDTTTFRMWYGATDSYFNQVTAGYAESTDGSSWTKHAGNPLVGLEPGPLGKWNDWVVSPGAVLLDGDSYHMWFAAWEYNGGAIDSGASATPRRATG